MGKRRSQAPVALAHLAEVDARLHMVQENQDHWSVLKDIEVLFQDLLDGLPEKCAKMQVKAGTDSMIVDIMPSNTNAARLRAIVPKAHRDGVILVAGEGSFFEIPPAGHRYTNFPLVEEARSICLAVIAGKLEETVTYAGSELLRGTGKIHLPDAMTVRWRRFTFKPFAKKKTKHILYMPYCTKTIATSHIEQ